jgi:hypothetical protein
LFSQGEIAVAIGHRAGNNNQKVNAVAVGGRAGQTVQGTGAVALGFEAGTSNQGSYSIAVGFQAGQNVQSQKSIILNASGVAQNLALAVSNAIVVNATNAAINPVTPNACYITPIRGPITPAPTPSNILFYNPGTREVTYAAKTFVIDHPLDSSRYLVHACLEGPEAGVYYRGKSEIVPSTTHVTIRLPEYAVPIATDFTVQITPIYSESDHVHATTSIYRTTEVTNGAFTVHGPPGRFFWHVHGSRQDIEVEPLRTAVEVKGSGPYRWI